MNFPVRILHTESSLNLGGQELRILLEMEKMRELGFASWLVARQNAAILVEAKKRGLVSFAVPFYNRLDPISMSFLWRLIRKEKIQVVNAHGSRDAWNAFLVARMLGVATIRSRHVATPVRKHWLGRQVYASLADRVVTTSESIKAGLVEAGVHEEKISVVPTGVRIEDFSLAKGKFRKEVGIPSDAILIGMVSVLRGDKGPDIFLEACSKLLLSYHNLWCVLVGDGPMRTRLEAQKAACRYPERVTLTGFRNNVYDAICDLDLFVLPSRQAEGVPQAILQAHAAKIPVVATRVAGVSEVAIEGETAFTCMPGNSEDLARAMNLALQDRARAIDQAERGHILVQSRYSEAAMLSRMAEIYRQVLLQT